MPAPGMFSRRPAEVVEACLESPDPPNGLTAVRRFAVRFTFNQVIGPRIPVRQNPNGVAINPAGTYAYVTETATHSVAKINLSKNSVTHIDVGSAPSGIAIDPAGQFAYVANRGSNFASKIRLSDDTVTNVALGHSSWSVAASAVGHHVYFTAEGASSLLKLNTLNDAVSTVPLPGGPVGVAVDATDTYAYVGLPSSQSVGRIDLSNNSVVSIPIGAEAYGVALNPAGTILYTANFKAGTVSKVNFANSAVEAIRVGAAGSTDMRSVAVNPAGTRVLATGARSGYRVLLSVIRVGPAPKPAVALGKTSAKVTAKRITLTSRVTVSDIGRIAQVVTSSAKKGKKTVTVTRCKSTTNAHAAGAYSVTCAIGKPGRVALRKANLTLTLRTTFTGVGANPISKSARLVLKRQK